MQLNQKPDDVSEKHDHHYGHRSRKHIVNARRCLHAPQIQHCESRCVKHRQNPVGHFRQNVLCQLAAQDGANQWVQDVIHYHRPAGQVAQACMNLLPDVGVGRSSTRIDSR